MKQVGLRIIMMVVLIVSMANLVSCATPNGAKVDPYESYNRKVYNFNVIMDKVLLRPVAHTYEFVTPSFVRARLTNVFANLDNVSTVFNDVLQFKLKFATMDLWRLVINTTLGLGGMFDMASHMGFPKHQEDFGLTLASWGATNSSYFVTPFLGPSTVRDTFGSGVDVVAMNYAAWRWIEPGWLQWALYGVMLVNTRANLLVADPLLDSAFDPYVFMRNAYMQQRKMQVAQNSIPFDELYKDYHASAHKASASGSTNDSAVFSVVK